MAEGGFRGFLGLDAVSKLKEVCRLFGNRDCRFGNKNSHPGNWDSHFGNQDSHPGNRDCHFGPGIAILGTRILILGTRTGISSPAGKRKQANKPKLWR